LCNHRVRQTDRNYLVWSDRRVSSFTVYHIVKTTRLFIPKQLVETSARFVSHRAVLLLCVWLIESCGEVFHDAQGVVPKRLNLNRLSMTRRDYPVADFRIHPGQLHARLA